MVHGICLFRHGFLKTLLTKSEGDIRVKEKLKLYLWIAKINLFISGFTFGGGYIVVPMVRKYFILKKELFTEDDLMEMAAVAQSSPGAIAINLVSLVGYRVAGRIGLAISCICAVLPPLVILSVVSVYYSAFIANAVVAAVLKGMQAGLAALIVDFMVDMSSMILKERSPFLDAVVVLSFLISFFFDINVILIILASCLICILRVWMKRSAVK